VAGSVSYLFYANRVFQLPFAIIALAITTTLFPAISKAIKNSNEEAAFANLSKAFWLLNILLGASVLGGILLSEPIIWLLFERGAFDLEDTKNTAYVLQMYMIGLVPFGLAKIFSLYLYAMHKHLKAAKIAVISLVINVIFSIILMQSMGAAGLALSGSIGGFAQLILTIKEVGFDKFWNIVKSKTMPIFIIAMITFGTMLYFINKFLIDMIR